jgi:hypothetical protein
LLVLETSPVDKDPVSG